MSSGAFFCHKIEIRNELVQPSHDAFLPGVMMQNLSLDTILYVNYMEILCNEFELINYNKFQMK